MFWQKQLDNFAARMSRHNVPLQLRLWGGHEVALGHPTRVTFEIKTVRALRRLLRPSMASLDKPMSKGKSTSRAPSMT